MKVRAALALAAAMATSGALAESAADSSPAGRKSAPRQGAAETNGVPTSAPLSLEAPPWGSGTQLPGWARSVRILKGDQPLRRHPDRSSDRRGSAARQTHLPLYGSAPGPGCGTPWLHVGAQAWVCGTEVMLSGSKPVASGRPRLGRGLPFQYFFAGRGGALGYERPEEVDVGAPAMTFEPGFAVAVVEQRRYGRVLVGRTNRGLWIPLRDFGPARPLSFEGSVVSSRNEDGAIPFAWVYVDSAPVYGRRGRVMMATGARKEKFTRVAWRGVTRSGPLSYVDIGGGAFVRERDVRHPTVAPPPADEPSLARARWLDVELASQTLVAYEGSRPVFATLVSTGKGKRKGHPFETPKGVHRIWVKLLSTTMDNLENDRASRYWRIEDVPYVQFFHKGVGLHGAFWHRSFGRVRSHGCVNLAPRDAERLYWFTGPKLPAGWTAVLPSDYDRGTVVRVR
ncbi:MAG: L,D-transpeptidase [Myxococcota bacterium]